jgi:N-acetylneuraminic acid mutarotase
MVYDTKRDRIVLFGGRTEATEVKGSPILRNDTWVWQNNDWTRINTTSAPQPRANAGTAYDIENDRVVLFGGTTLDANEEPQPFYDTWEFDGTNWQQVGANNAPTVTKPILEYDALRKQVLLIGLDPTSLASVMYRYDSSAKTWTQLSPATKPACVNEGHLVYQESNQKVLFMSGLCTSGTTNPLEEVFEWDGSTWTKITTTNAAIRAYAQAVTYDSVRDNVVVFSGSDLGTTNVSNGVTTYAAGTFRFPFGTLRPGARSLSVFQTDFTTGNIWLYGGLFDDGSAYTDDFWGYRAQQFYPIALDNQPGGACASPMSAYDADRGRLIVTCNGDTVFELESSTMQWKTTSPSKTPGGNRRFSAMAYDKKLKKTVMFGGYNTQGNYLNETWTWDGTSWAQVKMKDSEAPGNRGLMAMWYDPRLEKIVVYGGIGRPNLDTKAVRYEDMWSFDGTRWAKLDVTTTPGRRLGAPFAVDPTTGKLLLFGGLLAEGEDKTLTQTYVNDTWEWDGTAKTWTRLSPIRSPYVRENAMLAWDPVTNEMVLFGGFAYGFYRSDLWAWNGQTWRPLEDKGVRRRTTGAPLTQQPVRN